MLNRTSLHLHMGPSCNCCLRDDRPELSPLSWTLEVLANGPQHTPKAYEAGRKVADAMRKLWGTQG